MSRKMIKNFKQFVNEDLTRGKSVYGIISNNKIIEKINATNVEDAYKKYKGLDFFDNITVERIYDHTIDGVKYKTYIAYDTGGKTNMIHIILIDGNF